MIYRIEEGKNFFLLPRSYYSTVFQASKGDSIYMELDVKNGKLNKVCLYYTSMEVICDENVSSLNWKIRLDYDGEYRILIVNKRKSRIDYSMKAYRVKCVKSKLFD